MKHLSFFLGYIVYLIGFSSSEVDADDAILFEILEMVEWLQAEQTCQKNNGKLFKPNETSFDVSLFNEYNFNDALWVAATVVNINVYSFESASRRPGSVIKCEICSRERCETTCSFQACWNRCRAVCKYIFEPHERLSSEIYNWTEAKQWCSEHQGELGDMTQNALSLFFHGLCDASCFWTGHVMQVQLKPEIAPIDKEGGCCILHDGTLAFTSCSSHLHPLCERVATTTMTTTQTSRRTNGTHARIITSSKNGTSTDANESTSKENVALIGGFAGAGVVLTIIIIIVVLFLLRRSKQNRNRNLNSQGAINHDNVLKAKIHVNYAYDDVNGEVTYSNKHTSIEIQHMERESITYATPSNVEGYSEIIRDKNSGIITNGEQKMTVLYSKVQKRPNAGQNLHNMNQTTVGDEEYDKINFDKSYTQQAEHLGDVYDQTNVNCEHREEYFENVYNKAEFCHKRQNMDAGDVYDKANFHGGQQDNRSEYVHSDEENASPDLISENIYDKTDCLRRLQDGSSGYL